MIKLNLSDNAARYIRDVLAGKVGATNAYGNSTKIITDNYLESIMQDIDLQIIKQNIQRPESPLSHRNHEFSDAEEVELQRLIQLSDGKIGVLTRP